VRVLSIVHERTAGAGVFAQAAGASGAELVEWIPSEQARPPRGPFAAVLVFGGAMHADQEAENDWLGAEKALLRELLAARMPALGVCLGAQLLAEAAGGRVTRMPAPEIGWTPVQLAPATREDPVLGALPQRFSSFQWHSYELSPPSGAVALASSASCLQAFALDCAPWWGIQFHAEATLETVCAWIEDYRSDPDAVDAGLDWPALTRQSAREIARWNELGDAICTRFLAHAQAIGSARSEGGSDESHAGPLPSVGPNAGGERP
jgi:GMP synthase-like glutamine amidotransferase